MSPNLALVQSSSNYIDLLKRTLVDFDHVDSYEYHPLPLLPSSWKIKLLSVFDRWLQKRNFHLVKRKWVTEEARTHGYDWPARAQTMVGLGRLNQLEQCIYYVLNQDIKGDLVETGVWRGGVVMLMAALLDEQKASDRTIWAFDSFEGLPSPNTDQYPQDRGNTLHKLNLLSVSLEEVMRNFQLLNIPSHQVRFVKGWFKDTLPNSPIRKIAVLRLDGDYYESTHLALKHLYPMVSTGGYVIVDDYNAFSYCKAAVDDYRAQFGINCPIISIDQEAVYWQKL